MATKKVFYDNEVEMEIFSNDGGIHLEISSEDTDPSFIITLSPNDVEELIQELQQHVNKVNGF